MESHLLQMRGLKHLKTRPNLVRVLVASFTDAWIETKNQILNLLRARSRIFYRCVD